MQARSAPGGFEVSNRSSSRSSSTVLVGEATSGTDPHPDLCQPAIEVADDLRSVGAAGEVQRPGRREALELLEPLVATEQVGGDARVYQPEVHIVVEEAVEQLRVGGIADRDRRLIDLRPIAEAGQRAKSRSAGE